MELSLLWVMIRNVWAFLKTCVFLWHFSFGGSMLKNMYKQIENLESFWKKVRRESREKPKYILNVAKQQNQKSLFFDSF